MRLCPGGTSSAALRPSTPRLQGRRPRRAAVGTGRRRDLVVRHVPAQVVQRSGHGVDRLLAHAHGRGRHGQATLGHIAGAGQRLAVWRGAVHQAQAQGLGGADALAQDGQALGFGRAEQAPGAGWRPRSAGCL